MMLFDNHTTVQREEMDRLSRNKALLQQIPLTSVSSRLEEEDDEDEFGSDAQLSWIESLSRSGTVKPVTTDTPAGMAVLDLLEDKHANPEGFFEYTKRFEEGTAFKGYGSAEWQKTLSLCENIDKIWIVGRNHLIIFPSEQSVLASIDYFKAAGMTSGQMIRSPVEFPMSLFFSEQDQDAFFAMAQEIYRRHGLSVTVVNSSLSTAEVSATRPTRSFS